MDLVLFVTVFALLFYISFLGLAFGLKYKSYFFEELFLELIPKSLFLSWITFFICYSLNLPNIFWLFLILCLAFLFWRKPQAIVKLDLYSVIILVLALAIGFGFITHNYDYNFTAYDAVVSWNRWAKELYANEYVPVNSEYPIFFPGLWSLIYKAQGSTDIWIIAKLCLFVTPILLILSSIAVLRKNIIVGLCLAGAIGSIYFHKIAESMLNGYMDGPVSGFILVSILALILSIENHEENLEDDNKFIYISSFLFGIAAITKQAGYLSLIFFFIWLAILFYKKRLKRILLFKSIAISLIPLILFVIIFIPTKGRLMGNIDLLKQLSEQRTSGEQLTASFNYLKSSAGSLLFYTLLILSFLNIVFIKKTKSQLGLLLLAFSCIGFYLYQDCCSYSARNGWWILSFLIGSALCTALQFKSFKVSPRYSFKFNWIVLLISILSLSAIVSMNFSMDQLERITEKESNELIPQGAKILNYLPEMGDEGIIISKAYPMSQHKKLYGKIATTFSNFETINSVHNSIPWDSCHSRNKEKFKYLKYGTLEAVLFCLPKSLVHVNKKQYLDLVKNNPDFKFEVIDSSKGYKLYKPILVTENTNNNKHPDEK